LSKSIWGGRGCEVEGEEVVEEGEEKVGQDCVLETLVWIELFESSPGILGDVTGNAF